VILVFWFYICAMLAAVTLMAGIAEGIEWWLRRTGRLP
jgi:hypothetical protein